MMEKIFEYAQQNNLNLNKIDEEQDILYIDDSKIESFHSRFKSNEDLEELIQEYVTINTFYIKIHKIYFEQKEFFLVLSYKKNKDKEFNINYIDHFESAEGANLMKGSYSLVSDLNELIEFNVNLEEIEEYAYQNGLLGNYSEYFQEEYYENDEYYEIEESEDFEKTYSIVLKEIKHKGRIVFFAERFDYAEGMGSEFVGSLLGCEDDYRSILKYLE